MSGPHRFPELGLRHRVDLFNELTSYPFSDGLTEVRFGVRRGWIIIDPSKARALLRQRDLAKGRSAASRSAAGGYQSQDGEAFHHARRDVVVALARAAVDTEALGEALSTTVGREPPERANAPAVFTRWMLSHLVPTDPINLGILKCGAAALEAVAESAQSGHDPEECALDARAEFARALADRVEVAGGPFLDELRSRGWTTSGIVAELMGLAIAGWESTAAAVTTALTIGLPKQVTAAEISELLRLYPPSWLIARVSSGTESWCEKGDILVVSPWLSHRSRAWRDADQFLPERNDRSSPFPFGAGPRRCPADLYARAQVTVAINQFGGREGVRGQSELLGHRSATIIPTPEPTK